MQEVMGYVFMPTIVLLHPPPLIHLHPPHIRPPSCPHCYHFLLRHEQENNLKVFREIALKSIWKAPEYNLLKLNTDGSSKGNPGPSSFGGLIRDGKGRWLGGYFGKMKGRSYTSLEAEIWSIFKGLCLLKKRKISNVLIETDCVAVLTLGVQGVHKDDWIKSVMEAIGTIMIEQKCTLIHTRRDGNHCADQLAKLGGAQSEEYAVLEEQEPPVELIPYLLGDMEAALESEKN